MSLVTVRHDSFRGWVVTCAICGQLAVLGAKGGFWPAKRMAEDHEGIHQEDETSRPGGIGGLIPEPGSANVPST